MRREALYSSSSPRRAPARSLRTKAPQRAAGSQAPDRPATNTSLAEAKPTLRSRFGVLVKRNERPLWLVAGVVLAFMLVAMHAAMTPEPQKITQKDIDAAVQRTLESTTLPSQAAKAAAVIGPSVVRVRRLNGEKVEEEDTETAMGTGVVIIEDGTILTNIHVVEGASRVGVVFANGLESEAVLIAKQPEDDLAVLKARIVPDDLVPATMRSTADLKPGDHVVAVGFPFGIGPSTTAGVVSGLRRDYYSPQGERLLRNLIQFDAAVNPGNSGGPLVTSEGELVGIVTGILNPTGLRVFAGLGFAVPIENAAGAVGMHPF